MDRIDLDELQRVAADYDRRKEAARTFEIENFGSTTEERARYLAALKYGEATKAFEALRPLVARVRELERQREFFLKALKENSLCPARGCFDGSELDEWDCTAANNRECWIKAAKEAGE